LLKKITLNGKKLGYNRLIKDVSSIKIFLLEKNTPDCLKECHLETLTLIKNAETLEYHRAIAERQRKSFQKDKLNVKNGTILIVMDWKEKIKIGKIK
jgi:hypothetical protein